jgi:hypothetical protein
LAYPVIKRRKKRKEDRKMLRHRGGHKAGKGTYWNLRTGSRVDIAAEGVLPGDGNTVYHRFPAAGILVVGPIIGLLYAAFLPFIGIAMLVKLIVQKTAALVVAPARSGASFGWRPSESYLAGMKKKGSASDEAEKKDEHKE